MELTFQYSYVPSFAWVKTQSSLSASKEASIMVTRWMLGGPSGNDGWQASRQGIDEITES